MVGVEVLQKNEPYYIPGYTGYVPRNPFICGKTYGNLTHETLLDPAVDHSDNLVLVDREKTHETVEPTRADLKIIKTRSERTNKIYAHPMIPGYTGFVPHLGDERDKPWEIQAIRGIASFERQQLVRKIERELLRNTIESQNSTRKLIQNKVRLPLMTSQSGWSDLLKTQTLDKRRDKSKYFNASPYFMDNHNPEKYFMNGYTGYIPHRHLNFGKTRKVMANDGLRQFTANYRHKKNNEWSPVTMFDNKKESRRVSQKGYEIYRKDTALMPTYTGHVPGAKEKIGKTFGFSSKDANRLIEDHLFNLGLKK